MVIEIDELVEIENGLKIETKEGVEGPIYLGGPLIPIGLDFPLNTHYVETRTDGVKVWRKFGNDPNQWCEQDGAFRNDVANFDFYVPLKTLITTPCRQFDGDIIVDGEMYFL